MRLDVFRAGLEQAIRAASEEHDRDEDEVLCPRNVTLVHVAGTYAGGGTNDWKLEVRTSSGETFVVTAQKVAV
jgi:hypothetical protein